MTTAYHYRELDASYLRDAWAERDSLKAINADLLAALKSTHQYLCDLIEATGIQEGRTGKQLITVAAAIAKAEGQQ